MLFRSEWVFGGIINNMNKSVVHVTKVLESAAARSSEESGWLLDKLRFEFCCPSSRW